MSRARATRSSQVGSPEYHRARKCDCYKPSIAGPEKRCNYRSFEDDWSFVPDVGKTQSRGEIFTPRWVVDQMIVESGMLPAKAVHDKDYSKPKAEYIEARVIEPAVGTANYLATILYHKTQYAKSLSTNQRGRITNLDQYHTNLLTAVASVYAYDVDSGNLETSKRRLLSSGKQKINTPQAVDWWTSRIVKTLNHNPDKKQKIGYSRVRPSVKNSLNEAQRHWHQFIQGGSGIIDSAYKDATGERMPSWLYEQCQEILDKNIQLFNGIKEGDTLDWHDNLFIPGYKFVTWTWWYFRKPHEQGWQPSVSEKEVSYADMLI